MTISRRRFLSASGAAGALLATGAWRSTALGASAAAPPPLPDHSGIEHIVVVMMENRSFDHFLGWMPGADGRQAGLTFTDGTGRSHSTYHLTETMGCAHPDPDHSYEGGRAQFNGGKMDGWLHHGSGDDIFALGYYHAADRPFMSELALNYTTLDRYFCSILAETYPNRFFMHSATTDRLHNNGIASSSIYPTIWDRLRARGVSHQYYFGDIPFLGLWGQKYTSISSPWTKFLADAADGTLPAVSYVDPRFLTETSLVNTPGDIGGGTSNDDHPHGDIRAGDNFLATTFFAVANGPKWANTVFIINYDEWGGFYDHVPPPRAAASARADRDVAGGKAQLGFRVPCIVASPFTRGNPRKPRIYGSPTGQKVPFDHASVLKLIEWRFGLEPLTARDASNDVGNLLDVFDFAGRPDASVPSLPLPPPPPPDACVVDGSTGTAGPAAARDTSWQDLRTSGLLRGWNLPT